MRTSLSDRRRSGEGKVLLLEWFPTNPVELGSRVHLRLVSLATLARMHCFELASRRVARSSRPVAVTGKIGYLGCYAAQEAQQTDAFADYR
jgi:hypothetical protein